MVASPNWHTLAFGDKQDKVSNFLKWEIFSDYPSWIQCVAIESKIEQPFQGHLLISKEESIFKSSLKQLYNEPMEQITSWTYMKRQEELNHADSFDKQFFSFLWTYLKVLPLLCMKAVINYFMPSFSLGIPPAWCTLLWAGHGYWVEQTYCKVHEFEHN